VAAIEQPLDRVLVDVLGHEIAQPVQLLLP
jgi:hypothetical protein